jgi:hypothetical protein
MLAPQHQYQLSDVGLSCLLLNAPAAQRTCCSTHLLLNAPAAQRTCCSTHLLLNPPAAQRTCCSTLPLSCLAVPCQVLLQQYSELAATNSQLQQRQQQLSDQYDASLPELLALQQQLLNSNPATHDDTAAGGAAAVAEAGTSSVNKSGGSGSSAGLKKPASGWSLLAGNLNSGSSSTSAAELQLFSNLQLMLPLFGQLPPDQQQCVLAIAGSVWGNLVQQLYALLPELESTSANCTVELPAEQQQQQQQQQGSSLLQPELSMMPPPPHQQQQQHDQSGSFVLPELSVLMASPQQQQQQQQQQQSACQQEASGRVLNALQTELSVTPMLWQQQQQQQQLPGVIQPVLSAIPPHQLLLQQQCMNIAAQDYAQEHSAAAAAAGAAAPMLSVVASTSASASAAATAATGCVMPAVSVDPFVVAAAADWEQQVLPQVMHVAVTPDPEGTATAALAAHAAAAAAAAAAVGSPVKRDRVAFKKQQQQQEQQQESDAAELIRLMGSSLSLSADAPCAKQQKLAASSSNRTPDASTDNTPLPGARSFSLSLQLPSGLSGLSLPEISGLSSPLVTISSNGFAFDGSIDMKAASAGAAQTAADGSAAVEDVDCNALAEDARAAAPATAEPVGPAMQQALALRSNLLLLIDLLVSGGPTLLFRVFGSSPVSSVDAAAAAAAAAGDCACAELFKDQQLIRQCAWDSMQMVFPGNASALEPAAAAAATAAAEDTALCFGSVERTDGSAAGHCNTSNQQRQQVLRGISLSEEQRQALQQLLNNAVASHAANRLHLLQQLALLDAELNKSRSRSSIASAAMCSSGTAWWEAGQSLVEALHASCDSDTAVLQRVLQQCWGPQVRAAEVNVTTYIAAATGSSWAMPPCTAWRLSNRQHQLPVLCTVNYGSTRTRTCVQTLPLPMVAPGNLSASVLADCVMPSVCCCCCCCCQSTLSVVQQVRCLAAAHPFLPGYCTLERLLAGLGAGS